MFALISNSFSFSYTALKKINVLLRIIRHILTLYIDLKIL